MRRLIYASIVVALVAATSVQAQGSFDPRSIDGLEAWYDAGSARTGEGNKISEWPDESGRGHHLTSDQNGVPAKREAEETLGRPVVLVGAGNSYSVTQPFTLGSHTIFVVYQARLTERALFRAARNDRLGVVLRKNGRSDQYLGEGGIVRAYTAEVDSPQGFSITVLGRDGETLKSFINGREVSSDGTLVEDIEVGAFFKLEYTQVAGTDAKDLQVAEMLFYSRYLSEGERNTVTGYLAGKYAIDAAVGSTTAGSVDVESSGHDSLIQLSTDSDLDVNGKAVAIPWSVIDILGGPFSHDADEPTRLVCTRDETLVRLYVSLPLVSTTDDANIGVFFRLNGTDYQRGQGLSGPLGKDVGRDRGTAQANVVTTMSAGDYVEVVAMAQGAEGPVKLEPGYAVFIAEVK